MWLEEENTGQEELIEILTVRKLNLFVNMPPMTVFLRKLGHVFKLIFLEKISLGLCSEKIFFSLGFFQLNCYFVILSTVDFSSYS